MRPSTPLKWLGVIAATLFFAPILLLMLASAIPAKHRDVSSDPKYADKVGQRCVVLKGRPCRCPVA